MPTAAIVSYRLGGLDGVSIEAEKWRSALTRLGYDTTTVAGQGPVDHLVGGLRIEDRGTPDRAALARALVGADLVVAENICSLPLNPQASAAVADVCRGRPSLLHHHDLPWQRPHLAHLTVPDDPRWRHVTINARNRVELGRHGIEATTIYNSFDPDPSPGNRSATRDALGVEREERLVLQPTRALARKNVGGGIQLAEALGATFWLLGPAEDGYGPELARLVAAARCRVLLGPGETSAAARVADAYAACDVVVMPSTEEGFGNPALESAIYRRPLSVGPYPVAAELVAFGFDWFGLDEPERLGAWLDDPDDALLERNAAVVRRHFSLTDLPQRVAAVLPDLGPPQGPKPPEGAADHR
jgi:glycosyltransferase involved in cell wall biosynthesis